MSTFQMPSEISVLKTKAASQKGTGVTNVQTVWPVPKFSASTTLNDSGGGFEKYVVHLREACSPLGAALPNHTVLKWGAYFPPGTMVGTLIFNEDGQGKFADRGVVIIKFPDGVLVPIHARMCLFSHSRPRLNRG
ncbi:hypothetical protein D1P53_000749 [Cryptococcus gattii VGV]|nr:hypothetical protein D1P53_000749 [Cryptococcus gattii VGV]